MAGAKAVAESDQIGRLGVIYVRSLLAQAGVVHNEIPGGEDHLAVDLTLTFPVGSVSVQVKTGTSGLVGVDGLAADDVVTAEQMNHLFGTGSHPLTGEPLGAAYKVYDNTGVDGFNAEVARRVRVVSTGSPTEKPPDDVVARLRSEVARERFVADHGREPETARELSDALARYSRPRQTAVAGFDLTFLASEVGVSTLGGCARAGRPGDRAGARCHRPRCACVSSSTRRCAPARGAAVPGRSGPAGRSRPRSPIATPGPATPTCTPTSPSTRSGKWLSIYGTVLHEHVAAASEAYNTALERRLVEALGVVFVERPGGARDKRPVREIDGVPAELCERWSERRKAITARERELARAFEWAHGRPPTPVETVALAQQANLETREPKHQPRSEAEQRATWRAEVAEVMGSAHDVDAMVRDVVSRRRCAAPQPPITSAWVREAAERVIAEVESRRATWQVWHLRAEAQGQVREVAVPADRVAEVVEWIVDDAVGRMSVNLTPDVDPIPEPAGLRGSDGSSVYRHTGRDHYTSRRVLEAGQRIVALAGRYDGLAWSPDEVELSVLASALEGVRLNPGQEALVTAMATSGARVQLALAPAGSGKTTAMQVLASVWTVGGCNVLGLAPSAATAAALAAATGMPCETLAKLTHVPAADLVGSIGPGTLVVIDEAGMADTLTLASVIELAVTRGRVGAADRR